jgi:hypothetical protein
MSLAINCQASRPGSAPEAAAVRRSPGRRDFQRRLVDQLRFQAEFGGRLPELVERGLPARIGSVVLFPAGGVEFDSAPEDGGDFLPREAMRQLLLITHGCSPSAY